MRVFVEEYLSWLRATNHAVATVRNQRSCLYRLLRWCAPFQIEHPAELSRERLERFRLTLFEARLRTGQPLAWGTQAEYLGSIKAFLGWAVSSGLLVSSAGVSMRLPKRPFQLPMSVLNSREAERVLRRPDSRSMLGLRDRAVLEVLYSTGLRRAEVAHLHVADIDQVRGVVLVRAGKGQRDRVVPCGKRALGWVRRYLKRSRPRLVGEVRSEFLFVSSHGTPMLLNRLSERVRRYVEAADVAKAGSCHLFRHSMATLLLEGGADVRDVQAILGHTNLATTARYTHVSIVRLQAVHARAHPAEQARRVRRGVRQK